MINPVLLCIILVLGMYKNSCSVLRSRFRYVHVLFQPELLSSIKSPKEISKVLDAEWSGSDRPVLATQDGCVHMFDLSLKKAESAIEERDLQGNY